MTPRRTPRSPGCKDTQMLELIAGGSMNRRYVMATTFLGIAACATSGPESPVPVAKVETPTTTSSPTAAESVIEVVDVPKVPKTVIIPAQSQVVCHKEKPTGSHRVIRVCRTRSQIANRRTADQAMLKNISNAPVPQNVP